MKITMEANYGAKANGVYWLLKGATYDTDKDGISEKLAMTLIGIGKARHLGEVNELWGKEQAPVAKASKNPGRKVTSRANSSRRNSNTNKDV